MVIYKVENIINGKIYIGQTQKDVNERIYEHLYTKNYLGSALRKYGIQSFVISVIDSAYSKEVLDEKEKYWIRFYDSKVPNGYNLTDGGDGIQGYRHNEETKIKISKSNKGKIRTEEARENYRRSNNGRNKGFVHSPETIKKRSIKLTGPGNGMYGKNHSEETRRKMRDAWKYYRKDRAKLRTYPLFNITGNGF